MAAIKRSQANQRRHPDTFHFYQLQQQQQQSNSSSSSFSGIKVELQQLILAILDDPVVSRVFNEAGFRSTDIKMAVLRPAPRPILRFPRSARCPPLFLCNFAAAGQDFEAASLKSDGSGFSFPYPDNGGDDNCRKIAEIMRKKSHRNPVLVGVGAGYATEDFARSLERENWGLMHKLKYFCLEKEILRMNNSLGSSSIQGILYDLGREIHKEEGLVVGIGDLKELVELSDDVLNCFISEITRVLGIWKERLWVMSWSATYETYMKFLSTYPTLDKDWDLHLQLITSARPSVGGLAGRAPSLMESFIPFGGFFPAAYESNLPVMGHYQSMPRCQHCNDKYQQDLANIGKKSSLSSNGQGTTSLPSWLWSVDTLSTNCPSNSMKPTDDGKLWNAGVVDLEKKWNEYCQQGHQSFSNPEGNKHPILSPIITLPFVPDMDRPINVISPIITQSQTGFSSPFPVTMELQKIATTNISLPIPGSESTKENLTSKLHVGLHDSRQLKSMELKPQSAYTDVSTHKLLISPLSVTSVTTDLVLGMTLEPHCSEELAHASPTRKVIELNQQQSCPSSVSQKFDPSDFKSLYSSFLEKLGRQDEAVFAICQAIIRQRTGHKMLRGACQKGDLWFGFLGLDSLGKKRAAEALAELMFGSRENLICIDLGCQDSRVVRGSPISDQCQMINHEADFRGKAIADCISGEIRRKPSSVIFLKNVDRADFDVQESLSHAVRTGKIFDTCGREVDISNAIFVLTIDGVFGKTSSPNPETCKFSEEKILAAKSWEMSISVEFSRDSIRENSIHIAANANVSIASSQEPASTRKRKVNAFLDLNVPLEEMVENDAENCSSRNRGVGRKEWLDKFLNSLDVNINFKPYDFDWLSAYILKEISKRFCTIIGSEVQMEIDLLAMEEILAASWLLEDAKDLNGWFDDVLLKSLTEVKRRYSNMLSSESVVRLVATEERFTGEKSPVVCLPSMIHVD